ncbi:MAG: MFS transporter [Oscillospiraceae bacterium]|nr:MFS transporter [Oscillospiraceae bacterium]MBR6677300.1 MFS transporter [Oscillospiraceae bacterium]
MKKDLTLRYTLQQMAYWAAAAGVMSFATAYLLAKDFPASQVGVLLASGNLLSCLMQPILAERADRAGGDILKKLIVGMSLLSALCFALLPLLPLPRFVFGLLYLMGVFFLDAMLPLLNAISVAYNHCGCRINYGLGRGIGSFAFSIAALVIGKVIAAWGADWMIALAVALLLAHAAATPGYPSLGAMRPTAEEATRTECCSLPVFFSRYRWYCASLFGVALLAMFHAMTENYLIETVKPLGGDSGSVGVALFIATLIEMPVLIRFDQVRRRIADTWLLKIAGISFLIKAVLFLLAGSVAEIYLLQLLQATSYAFLSPTQLYYASHRVAPADMVKGQACITASYALGCALGNFAGGQLLHFFSLRVMLWSGVGIALAGTVILFLTVEHRDEWICREAAK